MSLACTADNREGAGRTGDWTIGERRVTREPRLRLTSVVCFFVDDKTAGARPRSSAGGGQARAS